MKELEAEILLESIAYKHHNLSKEMSDETTQDLPDSPSFEEKVLAQLDAINSRLQALENQAERRAIETKPIWERALAEILDVKQGLANVEQGLADVKQGLANVERKIDVLSRDIVQVRADQAYAESRLDKLESKPAQ